MVRGTYILAEEAEAGSQALRLLRCLNRTWYTIRIEQNVA